MIKWNEPRFDESDIKAVSAVLRDNYVNEGPKTRELEERLRDYLGVNHVVMVANGTAALFLALQADSIIRGVSNYEVIVPDMTMIATATSVNWAGGTPIPVDVRESNATINVERIRSRITDRTTAIIPVHALGRAADMSTLESLAKEYKLTIIEDAAGALGSKNDKGYLGTQGKVGCFSLQSNKIITSGQGGFVVTNDEKYYEVMRRVRDFGRLSNKDSIHEKIGYNLKFSDLAAALALSQFGKIEARKKLLSSQHLQYLDELSSLAGVQFFQVREGEISLWVDLLVRDRDGLAEHLGSKQIGTRNYWPALHRNPPYHSQGTDCDFPVSSKLSDSGIWLPNGPAISSEEVHEVCESIKEFYS